MFEYGFIENQDFEVFDKFIKNPNGGRPLIDYALSIAIFFKVVLNHF